MKAVFVSALFALAALAQEAGFTINTPINPPVCQPVMITWSGGQPPYFLSLRDGNSGSTITDFGQQQGTSFRWVVNQPVGSSLGFDLRDNTGAVAQSGNFNVQTSSDTSCLNASGSGSSSSAAGSTTSSGTGSVASSSSVSVTSSSATAPAGTTTTPAGTVGATSGSSTGAAATSGSSVRTSASASSAASSAGASQSSSAAAPKAFVEMGAAGLIGAVAVALFA